MKIGIDIGGTNTDGVLLNQNNDIIKTTKLPTNHHNLTNTILSSCEKLTSKINTKNITRIVLSTTLATNVVTEEEYQEIGLLLIPGPGLNPNWCNYNHFTKIAPGYIDHRGREIQSVNIDEINKTISYFIDNGISTICVCGKFSTRNPKQELQVKKLISSRFPTIKRVILGHQLSGSLNFPRRVTTTYLNGVVQLIHEQFINAIKEGLENLNLKAPTYLLKADGGTMPLDKSEEIPIESINSGPAASIMGIKALTELKGATLGLDIGGTTTDISLFVNDEPLFKPNGIEINNYKTLVRGLYNESIGCGGDSLITIKDGKIIIGPQRKGKAAAFGGPAPTPTDALVVLGLLQKGDEKAAKDSLKPLASNLNLSLDELANKIINKFSKRIKNKIDQILTKLNNQPVYTINKLLTDTIIQPTKLIGIGGPAKSLIPILANKLDLDYTIPNNSAVANAIGAALARVTKKCTLYADTEKGFYNIPELGIKDRTPLDFNLETAKDLAAKKLNEDTSQSNTKIEITNTESFNLVRGFNTVGKIIEVEAQIKPGLVESGLFTN